MAPSELTTAAAARPRYAVAVAVVVWQDERLLALRRPPRSSSPGSWNVVTGTLEAGEQPVAAALREVDEETGLVVELEAAPVAAYAAEVQGEAMVVIVYLAHHLGGEVTLNEENDAFAWLTPAEFESACPWPQLVQAVFEASRRRER